MMCLLDIGEKRLSTSESFTDFNGKILFHTSAKPGTENHEDTEQNYKAERKKETCKYVPFSSG